ncbi:hypothetical protein VD0002_g5275 [Verticillium dahliae]|nr:hypothetical protein VD0004_g5724 [Verticillium dahliae]PNH50276.1 hypothetical protein VD0003_g6896 [Verticillium dahliae]PNH62910.1 hypothetical protein VD0002_g5275 [Verticillium dahliae]PNH71918.1 hypothetical protein VD0001_g5631 [Verticillium dahliae]
MPTTHDKQTGDGVTGSVKETRKTAREVGRPAGTQGDAAKPGTKPAVSRCPLPVCPLYRETGIDCPDLACMLCWIKRPSEASRAREATP